MPADESRHPGNIVKEGVAQLGISLVIKKGDHVGQQDIVGPLAAKENGQSRCPIVNEDLFDRVDLILEQQGDRLAEHVVQGRHLCVIAAYVHGCGRQRRQCCRLLPAATAATT